MSDHANDLKKAEKPAEDALRLHPFYRGKIATTPKCAIRDLNDFSIWYSPGVAASCKAIAADPAEVYRQTNKGNLVAVVSDGTRVLGLGDIGPAAAMPVMEGKALLFKYLGGVDAFPICLDTKDPDKLVETVLMLQPTFGGINLEDIAQPKCFDILNRLRKEADIPVWHDDQQGTAAVTVAGVLNALKLVGKSIANARIAMIGTGAAGLRTAYLLITAGADPGNLFLCDSKGILTADRPDLKNDYIEKQKLAERTNSEGRTGGIAEAMAGADVVIALSKPGPGTILPEWVKAMAPDPIVFACANPTPEIWPWEAREAGAAVVATGRSDFPNQVNNSIGFPAIFRGALDVRARTITDEMCLAAAQSLADFAANKGLSAEYIVPDMTETAVFVEEAVAVGQKAIEQGVAGIQLSEAELRQAASTRITNAQQETKVLMQAGLIPPPPEG